MGSQDFNHGCENLPPIGRSEQLLAGTVWMGHHAQHVSLRIQDSCNVAQRSIWIRFRIHISIRRGVSERDSILCFERAQLLCRAKVISFHVPYGDLKYVSTGKLVGEWTIGSFDAKMNLPANVLESGIPHQSPGKQARFSKYLESVTDAEDQAARGGKTFDGLHHRGKPGNSAGSQVVAVGKSARNNNRIDSSQVFRIVPQKGYRLVRYF